MDRQVRLNNSYQTNAIPLLPLTSRRWMGLQRDTFVRWEIKNIIPIVWEDVEKYALNKLMVTSVQQHSMVFALFVLLFLQYFPVIDFAAAAAAADN